MFSQSCLGIQIWRAFGLPLGSEFSYIARGTGSGNIRLQIITVEENRILANNEKFLKIIQYVIIAFKKYDCVFSQRVSVAREK